MGSEINESTNCSFERMISVIHIFLILNPSYSYARWKLYYTNNFIHNNTSNIDMRFIFIPIICRNII